MPTVAIPVELLAHVPDPAASDRVDVTPTHALVIPDIATGNALTPEQITQRNEVAKRVLGDIMAAKSRAT